VEAEDPIEREARPKEARRRNHEGLLGLVLAASGAALILWW
jgi:hypothetical protein